MTFGKLELYLSIVALLVISSSAVAQTPSTTDKARGLPANLLGKSVIFTAKCVTMQNGTYEGYRCLDQNLHMMLDLDEIHVGAEHSGPSDQSDFNSNMKKNCNGARSAMDSNGTSCIISVKFQLSSYSTFVNTMGLPPETWLLLKSTGDIGTFAKRSEILPNDSGLRTAGED